MPVGVHTNLFATENYYVSDSYRARIDTALRASWADDHTKEELQAMKGSGSPVWVDSIAKIRHGEGSLDQAFKAAEAQPGPPLVVAILCAHATDPNATCCGNIVPRV